MKKQMIAALIATMLLTSCAAQGTQTDSAQTAEQATPTATPEPAYEGPLYEVSYEKIQDTIPAFRNPNISTTVLDDNGYLGMILRTDFAEDGVLNIAYDYHPRGNGTNGYYRYFCTTDLQPVPIEGDYDFLGYGNGYYLFAHEVGDDHNQRYVQLYDSDFNLVYDSTGAYDLQNWGPCNIYLNTGWMPGEKLATGEIYVLFHKLVNAEAAARMVAERPTLPPHSRRATYVAPLNKTVREPEVVVFTGTPEQMMWLCMSMSYYTGHRFDFHASGYNSMCVEAVLYPLTEQEPNILYFRSYP